MNALFVAGTDTDAGKTLVTGLLARFFQEQGRCVVTQKWAQTGGTNAPGPDLLFHLRMMKRKPADYVAADMAAMVPYVFGFPGSPHLASGKEKRAIRLNVISKAFHHLCRKYETVLVEGSGGLLVPLTETTLSIDLVKKLRLPVLLVAKNKLGGINHTLMSIEALRARRIPVIGVVFNNAPKENGEILLDNPRIVKKLSGVNVFGTLPRERNREALYSTFKPLARRILKAFLGMRHA